MVKNRKKIKKKVIPKTRKELRKEKRLQKKENKGQFFSKGKKQNETKSETVENKVLEDDSGSEIIESDFELSDEEIKQKLNKVDKKPANVTIQPDRFHENQQREKKKQHELQKKMRKRRIEQLKVANEEDDAVIRRLEKKLRIDKHRNEKSVHKMFDDGLDYALELCLPENIEKMYEAAKEAAELEDSEDEFEEDMAIALGKGKTDKSTPKQKVEFNKKEELTNNKKKQSKLSKIESKYFKDDLQSDISGSDSEFDNSDSESMAEDNEFASAASDNENSETEEQDAVIEESDSDKDSFPSDEESDGVSLEEDKEMDDEDIEIDDEDVKHNDVEDEAFSENKDFSNVWEDIYGRKRDKGGNVVTDENQKYIPPHVRARLEATEDMDDNRREKLEKLKKQCKGFLNRLSEANMHKIATQIENVYMSNPRFDVNNTLHKLMVEALLTNILAKDRMVLEHAMLIAVLHGNVGSEIGAHFLQSLVTRFDQLIKEVNTLKVEDKELDNVVFLISHLYTFKIMQHSLVFEIIYKLIENLCEKTVECILLVLRSVGFQLRKDDPGALKDLILSIQKKANESPLEIKENPRLKFMLDTLNAIKNNNVNKIPNYDPSLAEHLKKIVKSILTNGKYIATLNITLDDLLKADEKGKWWVVGSAWTGNIKDIGSANQENRNKNETEKFSEKLLELARQQRMNTEDRRNVFCIIMSAEDYVDAFERLLHLAIKDHRVIASIIIHCCLSEKSYNPYYSVLGQKFCEHDRKYQLAIQFAAWDRIKDIHSMTKTQITNFAQFLLHLIVNGGQPISVLKVVEFAQLDKITLRLVRQIILGLLLGKEEDCKQVFARIAPSTKLSTFKDSIRLFMHHFLLKGGNKNQVPREQLDLLKSRIAMAESVVSFVDSRVKF